MAFTAFRTWVLNEVITFTLLNQQVRDNGLILKTSIADDGTLAGILFSRTSANFIKNANTTLSDVTGLSFAIGASEVWLFWLALYYTSGTVPDLKFTFTVPAGCVGSHGLLDAQNSSSAGIEVVTAIPTSGSTQSALITGLAINSTTAGTIQLQAAQNVSDASDSKIFANSHIMAIKVG